MAESNPPSVLDVPGNPGPEWWASAHRAYQDLCQVLTHNVNAPESAKPNTRQYTPRISILPTGNFACKLTHPQEELECIAFGTIRSELFEEITWQNLLEWQEESGGKHVPITPYTVSGRRIVLGVADFIFTVRYVECPELVRSFPNILDVTSDFQETLPTDVEELVDTLLDLETCKKSVETLSALRPLYYFLRSWAEINGLYGPRSGFFNGNSLRITCQDIVTQSHDSLGDIPLSSVLRNFLESHRSCFSVESTSDCSLKSILNLQSQSQFYTLHDELAKLYKILENQEKFDPAAALQKLSSRPLTSKLPAGLYVEVTVQYSGKSQLQGTKVMEELEHEVHRLVKYLERASPSTIIRFWPRRLVSAQATPTDTPYEGFWIMSLTTTITKGNKNTINDANLEAIESVITKWNDAIYTHRQYTPDTTFVRAETLSQPHLAKQTLQPDTKHWPRTIAVPDPKFHFLLNKAATTSTSPSASITEVPTSQARNNSPQSQTQTTTSNKLRPALDILNRLIHDPSHNLDDYVIGYEDRHVGIMEKAARDWVKDSDEEDWIPQNRIRYFRSLSRGEKVWDREGRVDLVFV